MLEMILEKGGVLGLVAYLIYRDLISPRLRQRKYSNTNYDRRRRVNPNDKPGKAEECIKHRESLGKLGTKVKMMCESNSKEHTDIKDYIREKCKAISDNVKRLFELYDSLPRG